ncbi:MAG: hypothetical protein EOP04_06610 [Proteobacteria bacterium]|nr:MAG: hypothetical protein EOP04_06610 [Pseudomonadota bacterium]
MRTNSKDAKAAMKRAIPVSDTHEPDDKPASAPSIPDKTNDELGTIKKPEETIPKEEKLPPYVLCTKVEPECSPHRMILADYALGRVLHVNIDDPSKVWHLDIPGGVRDLQLIGGNKLLVGTVETGSGP